MTPWFFTKWSDLREPVPQHAMTSDLPERPRNAAPRAGFVLALTSDGRTLPKGGAGYFYDRIPLDIPAFRYLPDRTVETLDPAAGSSIPVSGVVSVLAANSGYSGSNAGF